MTQGTSDVVATWELPPWAEVSDSDEFCVIHSRALVDFVSLDGERLSAEFVQRDELTVSADGVAVTRDPSWVRLMGLRISVEEVVRVADRLRSVAELSDRPVDVSDRAASLPQLTISPVPPCDAPLVMAADG